MYFADAVNQLTGGRAAKRPNWAGYISREDVGEPTPDGKQAFKLKFVPRNGADPKVYDFSADGVITTAAAETLDPALLAGMLSDDWIVNYTAAFIEAATGTGRW